LADSDVAGLMTVFKNPYFFFPCIIFWANQYLERIQHLFIPFVHAYLDDLLAIPVVLGITLQVFRWIHPSKNQFVFTKKQIFVGWLYFSFMFEFALPKWSNTYTSDIFDVVCYGIGSVYFYKFINIFETKP
jgi:hypothetical protein